MPKTTLPTVFTVFPNAALARSELWDEAERLGGPRKPKFQKRDLDERRRQVSILYLSRNVHSWWISSVRI